MIAQGVARAVAPFPVAFRAAGMAVEVDSDDDAFVSELTALLGSPLPAPASDSRPAVTVRARVAGLATVALLHAGPHDTPADLVLAASSPDFPFHLLESSDTRAVLALRGASEPALVAEGPECRFALLPGWRKAAALLVLHRLMRARADAIFFHAASLAVRGGAALLVGAKGAGKSTLALALAARGHALLGDEHACYVPAAGALEPFRRPVGVKPGPRAAAVDALLAARGRSPERDGMMRVPVEELFPGAEPAGAPLRTVVFLAGFAPRPRLEVLDPARAEVGRLQPVGVSLLNAPRTRRVFEMSRLLREARVLELRAGAPDETSSALEEALSA